MTSWYRDQGGTGGEISLESQSVSIKTSDRTRNTPWAYHRSSLRIGTNYMLIRQDCDDFDHSRLVSR